MTVFPEEIDFGTVLREVGHQEQVAVEVWDIENVLEHRLDPFSLCKHLDLDAPSAHSRDGTVITKDNFSMLRKGGELCEPSSVRTHGSRGARVNKLAML